MQVQAFIFDLDGVLTNTAEYHYLSWKKLAEEEGISFDRQDNEAFRGISRRECLDMLLKGREVPQYRKEEMLERKNHYFRSMLKDITPADLLPGVARLLEDMRAANLKIAVASASKNAVEVLANLQLQDKIDALCDGYSVAKAKPAPDLFLCAAEKLGVIPANCVVVEDAKAGIKAARRAGMISIGLGPIKRVGKADLVLPGLDIPLQRILELLGERLGKPSP